MYKIIVVLTSYNRREKTVSAITKLIYGNENCIFQFVVVDDNSSDGTVECISEIKNAKLIIEKGDGSLFYSGGMRKGMQIASRLRENFDYALIINDDVEFFDNAIDKMIEQSKKQKDSVIVGTCCDEEGNLSYGAIKYQKGIKYHTLTIDEWETLADTFNANCVLIPYNIFIKSECIDSMYIHSLGDFDYGLALKRKGVCIHPSRQYIGICNPNSIENTWLDKKLSIRDRIRKKESIKGAPSKQWFYFLKKNFGIFYAIKGTISPFMRIILHM